MHLGSNPLPGRTCLRAFIISVSPLEFSWCPNWFVGNPRITYEKKHFYEYKYIQLWFWFYYCLSTICIDQTSSHWPNQNLKEIFFPFLSVIYLPIYRRISRRVHSSAWNHGPLFLIRLPYSQLTPLCLWAPRTWTRTHWAFWPTGRRRKTCP